MKNLLKIPALLFAIMLIVSSCGNDTKSDSGRNANDDAEKYSDWAEGNGDAAKLMTKARKADGEKQIKLYEEAADELEDLIEMMEYYMEDEDNYEKLVDVIFNDLDEKMPFYKEFKKIMKDPLEFTKISLEDWNEDLEELKDED